MYIMIHKNKFYHTNEILICRRNIWSRGIGIATGQKKTWTKPLRALGDMHSRQNALGHGERLNGTFQ
jgi:hypothetical protein